MKAARVDIAGIRREQIVEAAVAVIAEKGLQNLSLSEIEKKAGMSRGQLTYYFPAKEDILLAVFDRMLQLMRQRGRAVCAEGDPSSVPQPGWHRVEHLLRLLIVDPPPLIEFHSLQYTFLAQISHRSDFRQRLADLYEEWRQQMSEDLAIALAEQCPGAAVAPRALATLIQAILHGLAIQRNADAGAYDRNEMLDLCLELLGIYLGRGCPGPRNGNGGGHAGRKTPRPSKELKQEKS